MLDIFIESVKVFFLNFTRKRPQIMKSYVNVKIFDFKVKVKQRIWLQNLNVSKAFSSWTNKNVLSDWHRMIYINVVFWVSNHSINVYFFVQIFNNIILFSQELYKLSMAKLLDNSKI